MEAQQLAFLRQTGTQSVVVALNASDRPARVELKLPVPARRLVDLRNPPDHFAIQGGRCPVDVPPCWGRILQIED